MWGRLRALEVLGRGFLNEPLVELRAFKLSDLFLIQRANAQVADELTCFPLLIVLLGSKAFTISCHDSGKGPFEKRICSMSGVALGYSPTPQSKGTLCVHDPSAVAPGSKHQTECGEV